jgi:DNA-binding XRE family transcriptional regulator
VGDRVRRRADGRALWTGPQLRRLYARRRSGETTAALAAEAGVSEESLRSAWRRAGLSSMRARRPSDDDLLDLWARRLQGETTTALASELGVSRATLAHHWRTIGLTPQSARRKRRA